MRFRVAFREVEVRVDKYIEKFNGQKLLFIHPPKNGGTSVTTQLRKKYLSSFVLNNQASIVYNDDTSIEWKKTNEVRGYLLNYFSNKKCGFISGHFAGINPRIYQEKGYKVFTVLRDPIDTFISKYYFNKIEINFQEFLETDRASYWGCELVNRFCDDTTLKENEKYESALKNLHNFDHVGYLHDTAKTITWLKTQGKYIKIKKLNVNNHNKTVQDSLLNKVEKLCYWDLKLLRGLEHE